MVQQSNHSPILNRKGKKMAESTKKSTDSLPQITHGTSGSRHSNFWLKLIGLLLVIKISILRLTLPECIGREICEELLRGAAGGAVIGISIVIAKLLFNI